jgi:ABC-2 type transport system ATP-binding protein
MQAPGAVIEVDDLVFEYAGFRALDGVGFRIGAGSITALVGPNGAGKTTLLRCIAALDKPISGSVRLGGLDVAEHPRQCHRRLGYLSDSFGLYDDLTVRQCLAWAARAHGTAAGVVAAAVDDAVLAVGLADKLGARPRELSRGQRQRVAIAQAVIHRPDVLLLDEPASGLDPEARHGLAQLFLTLRDGGMTLLVSSHILAELEDYSSHMLVLRQGRVVEHRAIGAGHAAVARLRARFAIPADAAAILAAAPFATLERLDADGAVFADVADAAAQARLLGALVGAGLAVSEFAPLHQNMQDAYLATLEGGA